MKKILRLLRRRPRRGQEMEPEDIFIDAHNLPAFDRAHMEGRFEQPLSRRVLTGVIVLFVIVVAVFGVRLYDLQLVQGETFAERSKENRLRHALIFPERGVIYDRDRTKMAFNAAASSSAAFARRRYATTSGMAHLVGYLKYPSKDDAGVYYETEYQGKRGVESAFNNTLTGTNGVNIIEINATNEIQSRNRIQQPEDGKSVRLTVDATVQRKLFELIKERAEESGFKGGAGAIMNVETGEMLALTSYPEFDPQVMTNGNDEKINAITERDGDPFLNRAIAGGFIPGSIVKPFIATAALQENVIGPGDTIKSTKRMEVENPYDEDDPTVFYDWKEHGRVDVRDALAVSSNTFFYQVGGGYQDQEGLGISRIRDYMHQFGFGEETGVALDNEISGVVPGPEWKQEHFEDGKWRVGDTYNTAIGQYGFQVTPLQAVRATAAIANGGTVVTPHVVESATSDQVEDSKDVNASSHVFNIVRDGMAQAVESGTASGLNTKYMDIAAKTGTAEIGTARVNSWIIGFFPADEPRYAFSVVMERGPRDNLLGGVWVMRRLVDWMHQETPSYLVDTNSNGAQR